MSKSTLSPQASPPTYVVYLKIALTLIFELLLLVALFAILAVFLFLGSISGAA